MRIVSVTSAFCVCFLFYLTHTHTADKSMKRKIEHQPLLRSSSREESPLIVSEAPVQRSPASICAASNTQAASQPCSIRSSFCTTSSNLEEGRGRGVSASMQQYVVLMRHGERRDSLPNAVSEADPPLTENGKAEVQQAAQRIRDAIGQIVAKKLMIITSPFVRTMETTEELQKAGIGIDRLCSTIDNTLCEVFGPLRIKSKEAPDVKRKDAVGSLPNWGESIQDATRRYCDSFLQNANTHSGEHLLLVTHGDALSAVMSFFYPLRVVYNTEFLSFIVMRRISGDRFVLHGHHGVEWLLDGDEDEAEQARMLSGRTAAVSSVSYTTPLSGSSVESGSGRSSGRRSNSRRGFDDEEDHTAPWQVGQEECNEPSTGVQPPAGAAARRNASSNKFLLTGLHALVVASQLPILAIWDSKADCLVYLIVLSLLEILSFRVGWRAMVDRLPFSFGSPRRRVFLRLARYPLARAVSKLLVLIVTYLIVATPVSVILGGKASRPAATSLGNIVENVWNFLLIVVMVVLDVWRGYLENTEEDNDPHRESI